MPSRKLNIIFILLICFVASGCGNMSIVQRKHLPGFHVDRSSPRKSLKERNATTQHEKENLTAELDGKAKQGTTNIDELLQDNDNQNLTASASEVQPDITLRKQEKTLHAVEGLFSKLFGKTNQQKVSSEFRRAVFGQDEDERPWNELAIASLILGAISIALMLTGGVLGYMSKGIGKNKHGFYLVGAGIAIISAVVTGIIALKKKKFKVKKGRGLALAGLFSGVLAFVIGLIILIANLVNTLAMVFR